MARVARKDLFDPAEVWVCPLHQPLLATVIPLWRRSAHREKLRTPETLTQRVARISGRAVRHRPARIFNLVESFSPRAAKSARRGRTVK